MASVNVTIPDQLLLHARAMNLNISKMAAGALSAELNRLSKRAQFKAYLDELEAEFGPVSAEELAEGEAWADQVFGPRSTEDEPARRSA